VPRFKWVFNLNKNEIIQASERQVTVLTIPGIVWMESVTSCPIEGRSLEDMVAMISYGPVTGSNSTTSSIDSNVSHILLVSPTEVSIRM